MDFTQPSFYAAAGMVVFCPLFLHTVARYEHTSHMLAKAFGSPRDALYSFAAFSVILGLWRDATVVEAIQRQPSGGWLTNGTVFICALVLLLIGSVLYYLALYRLGVAGCFYGDHFGLPLEKRVTQFPFDTLDHPMATGSVMMSYAVALYHGSWAGVVLATMTLLTYRAIIPLEARFTNAIYGPYLPPVSAAFRILAMPLNKARLIGRME